MPNTVWWLICHIFGVGPPKIGPVTLKFELGWDLCTMHLPTKFNRPTCNHSEVITLTNKHTQNRDFVENIHRAPLFYAGGEWSSIRPHVMSDAIYEVIRKEAGDGIDGDNR